VQKPIYGSIQVFIHFSVGIKPGFHPKRKRLILFIAKYEGVCHRVGKEYSDLT